MESIESYHGEQTVGPLRMASYHEMRRSSPVADPYRLPATELLRFRPTRPILWMEGDGWIRKEKVWAPFDLVHSAYTTTLRTHESGFDATTSGLASGNPLLEAASHALCEVLERDCGAQFRALPTTLQNERRLDLTTIFDAACQRVLDLYRAAGVQVIV